MADNFYKYIKCDLPNIHSLLVLATHKQLIRIYLPFQKEFKTPPENATYANKLAIFENTAQQIHDYAQNRLTYFTVPILLNGTAHQNKVWQALQAIPYGHTRSYKTLANIVNSSPRAIGGANKNNPLPIIIPCHRVIKHNGDLGGYFGYDNATINLKAQLLAHEKNY